MFSDLSDISPVLPSASAVQTDLVYQNINSGSEPKTENAAKN